MTNRATDNFDTTDGGNTIEYRAIHAGAIVGVALLALTGVVTVATALSAPDFTALVAFLNLVPLVICFWSRNKIRDASDIYTGKTVALSGAAIGAVLLAGGVVYGFVARATEVPPDHTRITFNDMRPDEVQSRSGMVVPPEVQALDGKKIFIKGYMRPPEVRTGIERFLLVRDNNTCCFGSLTAVKYYDRILVDLAGKMRLNYSDGMFAVGGILKVMPENVELGPQAPVFALEADVAR